MAFKLRGGWSVFGSLLLCIACGTETNDKTEEQRNLEQGAAAGEGECGELSYESVPWDEMTELEVIPAEEFEPLEGTCTAPMTWDGSDFGDICKPATGESHVTVSLMLDRDSVEVGRYLDVETSYDDLCDELFLKVKGEASFITDDGVFDDAGEVEVLYGSSSGMGDIELKKEFGSLGGSFLVEQEDGDKGGYLAYRMGGAGDVCAGALHLMVTESLGDGVGMASMGEIGNWTNTGCPLGTEPVALDEPLTDDRTMLERYAEIFGDRRFDVTWDTGKETTINIAVEIPDTMACKEHSSISVPAKITYGTDDDMIETRTVDGDAGIVLSDTGLVRGASFTISDNRFCNGSEDDIGYGFGDCTTMSGVTIQLRMEWREGDEWGVSDDGLITYEYELGSEPGQDGAVGNHELSFSF